MLNSLNNNFSAMQRQGVQANNSNKKMGFKAVDVHLEGLYKLQKKGGTKSAKESMVESVEKIVQAVENFVRKGKEDQRDIKVGIEIKKVKTKRKNRIKKIKLEMGEINSQKPNKRGKLITVVDDSTTFTAKKRKSFFKSKRATIEQDLENKLNAKLDQIESKHKLKQKKRELNTRFDDLKPKEIEDNNMQLQAHSDESNKMHIDL